MLSVFDQFWSIFTHVDDIVFWYLFKWYSTLAIKTINKSRQFFLSRLNWKSLMPRIKILEDQSCQTGNIFSWEQCSISSHFVTKHRHLLAYLSPNQSSQTACNLWEWKVGNKPNTNADSHDIFRFRTFIMLQAIFK